MMRTIWRGFVGTIFWSYERGTWPYDVAVVVIVIFVLLTPRSWFHDRPPEGAPPSALVELRESGAIQVYRVDARLVKGSSASSEPALEHELHEAVRKNVSGLDQNRFQITRIDAIHGDDGTIAFYDVSVRP
jgi:hypothetical protein